MVRWFNNGGHITIRTDNSEVLVLVFRSGFLPRILGVLLIAACFGYLADSLTPLLLPSYEDVVGWIANIALTLGEPAIILWL